jgi:hypothetical protein
MHQNRTHFIKLEGNKLKAYEDTNDNGNLEEGSDGHRCMWERKRDDPADASCPGNASLSFKDLKKFPIVWSDISTTTLEFNPRGLYNTPIPKTICVFSTYNPSYDCIIVSQTRINIGKLKNQIDGCNSGISGNCQPKK